MQTRNKHISVAVSECFQVKLAITKIATTNTVATISFQLIFAIDIIHWMSYGSQVTRQKFSDHTMVIPLGLKVLGTRLE